MVEIILWILVGLILAPVVIYLCVKMAVLGYYRARQIARRMGSDEKWPPGV